MRFLGVLCQPLDDTLLLLVWARELTTFDSGRLTEYVIAIRALAVQGAAVSKPLALRRVGGLESALPWKAGSEDRRPKAAIFHRRLLESGRFQTAPLGFFTSSPHEESRPRFQNPRDDNLGIRARRDIRHFESLQQIFANELDRAVELKIGVLFLGKAVSLVFRHEEPHRRRLLL